MKTFVEYFAIVLAGLLVLSLLFVCGCAPMRWAFGFPSAPPVETPAVNPAAGDAPDPPKRAAATFPLDVFLGWLIPGAALCIAAVLLGAKPMVPIIAAGGIIVATAMAVSLAFWELLLSLVALAVIAALVFGVMWLRRSRMLAELVTKLQAKRDADPAFKATMNAAVALSPATSDVVNKIKGKKK